MGSLIDAVTGVLGAANLTGDSVAYDQGSANSVEVYAAPSGSFMTSLQRINRITEALTVDGRFRFLCCPKATGCRVTWA